MVACTDFRSFNVQKFVSNPQQLRAEKTVGVELMKKEGPLGYDHRVEFRTSILMHPAKTICGSKRVEGCTSPTKQLAHKRVRALIREDRKARAAVDIAYPRHAAELP